ncbi:hypothetical protein JMJ56_32500 [Belnapia sp. T18]|uniref:Uncharacterized protein n=1 Tax=Belnapia arida TaxID=2804533 RepID=A0ABS1UDB1_9PROT|nr:hypothetical protein [Belnapia arida]MBL6082686.1 hypothetical protein [Belnapia arida]
MPLPLAFAYRSPMHAPVPDPDPIGPDGTVRLRCYLPHIHIHYFSGTCRQCQRRVMIGIELAIQMMGSSAATAGELEQRLKCRCGGRVSLSLAVDDRSPETVERKGRLPQTMGMVIRE